MVNADGTDNSAVLEGVTITAGNADGNGDADSGFGGGLIADGGSPTLKNCEFTGNTAVSGGAMYIANQTAVAAVVTNCVFHKNTAEAAGAIDMASASPTIENDTFSDNLANNTSGGAILNLGSSPTITNCLFNGNSANAYGGAIYHDGSSPTITNCTFTANSADAGSGGAES